MLIIQTLVTITPYFCSLVMALVFLNRTLVSYVQYIVSFPFRKKLLKRNNSIRNFFANVFPSPILRKPKPWYFVSPCQKYRRGYFIAPMWDIFTFTETLTYLMLHSLAGLSPVAKIDNFPKSSPGGYQHIIFW